MAKNYLVLDASSMNVQVGLLAEGSWRSFYALTEPPLISLFKGVDDCLKKAQCELSDIDAFVYCEGPGSILGIRLAAMAIRTWRALPAFIEKPAYAYNSLVLAAKALSDKENAYVITQSRQQLWNVYNCTTQTYSEQGVEALQELSNAEFWRIQQRAHEKPFPLHCKPFLYALEDLAGLFIEEDLLKTPEAIDAVNLGDQEFRKWTSIRHQ